MEKEILYGNIIAGGLGTRNFPISNSQIGKQHTVTQNSDETYLQSTVSRLLKLGIEPTKIVAVVTNKDQEKLTIEQTKEYKIVSSNINLISDQYGYAGAIIAAAEATAEISDPANAIIVSTPSDQQIGDIIEFKKALQRAIVEAKNNNVVIIGVKTTLSEEVMECGNAIYSTESQTGCYVVTDFIEKPKKAKADELLRNDCSVISTGILVSRASVLLEKFSTKDIKNELGTDTMLKAFIKENKLKLSIGDFEWDDCGTIGSLYRVTDFKSHSGNVVCGPGAKLWNIQYDHCRRCFFWTDENIVIRPINLVDYEIIANTIHDKIALVITATGEYKPSVRRDLYNDFEKNADFTIEMSDFIKTGYDPTNRVAVAVIGAKELLIITVSNVETEDNKCIITISTEI